MTQHTRSIKFVPALTALSLALASAVASTGAYASAFQLTENSAPGLGRAQAGGAAVPGDCSAVVNNPAAMSDFTTSCLSGTVAAINFSAKFHGTGTGLLDGLPTTGGNGGDGGTTLPVPAAYFVHPINDQFALGIGLSVPFGFQTEYDDRWIGRYQSVETKLQSPALTFAGSWKLSDQFSVGASVVVQRTAATIIQDIDLGTILAAPTGGALGPQEADGQGGLKGHDYSVGYGLGLLWRPTQSDRFGLNFRSQIDHTLEGNATFKIPSNVLPLFDGAFVNGKGSADFNTPWYANLGWWHDFNDRFSMGVTANYTHWSSFQQLAINYANPKQAPYSPVQAFNYKDTWFGSIGGDYKLDNRWTIRGGVAYDETPTSDATRDPKVPDNSRKWVSVGLGYQYSDQLRFDAAFVHLFVDDAKVNDVSGTFNQLNGAFQVYGNVLAVSGQYSF
jgi:long-chain fatty acid transport protein